MSSNDDKLKALLAQWRSPEPGPGFEAGVWRRIRPEPLENRGWLAHGRAWLGAQPAWVNAVALFLGILLGAYAALTPAPAGRGTARLKPGTLAGNYVAMISRGAR